MANKKLKSVAVKTVPAVRSQRYVSDLDPLNIDPTNIETIIKISLIISVILAIIVILWSIVSNEELIRLLDECINEVDFLNEQIDEINIILEDIKED